MGQTRRKVVATWVTSLFLSAFILSVQGIPTQVNASTTVELSPSNGSSICPAYLGGPGVSEVTWNATTSTCTSIANPDAGPTVCIASSGGGCAEAAADVFVIDAGVTVVVEVSGNQWVQLAALCVYSSLVNYGTIKAGSFCDYGTVTNYGTIIIPRGGSFTTLSDNGYGILLNEKRGTIINNYEVVDGSNVTNHGTFNNRGIFDNSITNGAGVFYHGFFENDGDFVGSAPCFTYEGCHTWVGTYNITSGTLINMFLNGVILSVTGASGTGVTVSSENQTTVAPLGLGALNISSVSYYDVMVSGLSGGTAHLCITNSRVTQSMVGGMQYWNGNQWAFAQNQNVSVVPASMMPPQNKSATTTTTTPSVNMLCGEIPVVDLNGTPIGAGIPMSTSKQNTTTETTLAQVTTSVATVFGVAPSVQIANTSLVAAVGRGVTIKFNVTTNQPGTLYWSITNGTGQTAFLFLFQNEGGLVLPNGVTAAYPDGTSSNGSKSNVPVILTFDSSTAGKTFPLQLDVWLVPQSDPQHPIGVAETMTVAVGPNSQASTLLLELGGIVGAVALIAVVAAGLLWYRRKASVRPVSTPV